MTRAISLHGVSKVYPQGLAAVRDFSLAIDPGEFVVLLGPSGCGKSTVLRMIAGLEDLTTGELYFDGEPASHLSPADRSIAMIFQNFALYPSMTVRQNIGFPLKLQGQGENARPQVEATARMLGLHELLERYPGQISGGERQRVAMGRAMSRHPSAFLMDEPLSNLDAKLRNRLRAEISHLSRELGVTTVYVTHDQAEAMSLGDRVAVMRGGVLQQVATPRMTYALPANVFVAAFIGTPRINLLEGQVYAPLSGRMAIDLGSQRLDLPFPLSPDHQMLRIQQGRPIIVGLRSEAVRIAHLDQARPGEVPATGIVEHVEYQGHEELVHLNTGSRPALIPELESPRPDGGHDHRGGPGGLRPRSLTRLKQRAAALSSSLTTNGKAPEAGPPPAYDPDVATITAGDLIVRTSPDIQIRKGTRVPLQIDLNHLYVFDHRGQRICPAPEGLPGLD